MQLVQQLLATACSTYFSQVPAAVDAEDKVAIVVHVSNRRQAPLLKLSGVCAQLLGRRQADAVQAVSAAERCASMLCSMVPSTCLPHRMHAQEGLALRGLRQSALPRIHACLACTLRRLGH